jgi:gas vesicle protein
MSIESHDRRDYRFLIGVITGAFAGAGLAMWLVPRAGAELRERVADSAKGLGDRASEGYNEVSARVGDAVEDLTKKSHGLRDEMADAVLRRAKDVANAIKS